MHDNSPCHRASGVSRLFLGGQYSGNGLARKLSGYEPLIKCMVYSEAEIQSNAPHGKRRSRKKSFIHMGECYSTPICEKLDILMPDRIAEVITNRGSPTKF